MIDYIGPAVVIGSVALLHWAGVVPARADTQTSSSLTCQFESQNIRLADPDCKVTKIYDDSRRWTHTRIQWSDGVVTEIKVETINREPGDRVDSRYGLVTVDGYSAEYQTFSDGGICFTVRQTQNYFCYR